MTNSTAQNGIARFDSTEVTKPSALAVKIPGTDNLPNLTPPVQQGRTAEPSDDGLSPHSLSVRDSDSRSIDSGRSQALHGQDPESPSGQPTTPTENEKERYRPGLGPMMGKKSSDVVSKLRKAATANSAFKPRAGGAGERLLKSKMVPEPQAITSVVPAPSMARGVSNNGVDARESEGTAEDKSRTASKSDFAAEMPVQDDQVAPPSMPSQAQYITPVDEPITPITDQVGPESPLLQTMEPERSPEPVKAEPAKAKPRSVALEKSLLALDIDPDILGGRDAKYESVLMDFGWENNLLHAKQIDSLEMNLRREIGRLEAGSWLGSSDQKDERVEVVAKLLDKAIAECDELEGLLTLYSVELSVRSSRPRSCDILKLRRRSTMTLHTSKLNHKVCRYRRQTRGFFKSSSRTLSIRFPSAPASWNHSDELLFVMWRDSSLSSPRC